jgi:hypothetical protein
MHILHIVVVGAHTSIGSTPPGITVSQRFLRCAHLFMPASGYGNAVILEKLVESPNWTPVFRSQVCLPTTVEVMVGQGPPQHGSVLVVVSVEGHVGLRVDMVIVVVGNPRQRMSQRSPSATERSQKSGLMVVEAV